MNTSVHRLVYTRDAECQTRCNDPTFKITPEEHYRDTLWSLYKQIGKTDNKSLRRQITAAIQDGSKLAQGLCRVPRRYHWRTIRSVIAYQRERKWTLVQKFKEVVYYAILRRRHMQREWKRRLVKLKRLRLYHIHRVWTWKRLIRKSKRSVMHIVMMQDQHKSLNVTQKWRTFALKLRHKQASRHHRVQLKWKQVSRALVRRYYQKKQLRTWRWWRVLAVLVSAYRGLVRCLRRARCRRIAAKWMHFVSKKIQSNRHLHLYNVHCRQMRQRRAKEKWTHIVTQKRLHRIRNYRQRRQAYLRDILHRLVVMHRVLKKWHHYVLYTRNEHLSIKYALCTRAAFRFHNTILHLYSQRITRIQKVIMCGGGSSYVSKLTSCETKLTQELNMIDKWKRDISCIFNYWHENNSNVTDASMKNWHALIASTLHIRKLNNMQAKIYDKTTSTLLGSLWWIWVESTLAHVALVRRFHILNRTRVVNRLLVTQLMTCDYQEYMLDWSIRHRLPIALCYPVQSIRELFQCSVTVDAFIPLLRNHYHASMDLCFGRCHHHMLFNVLRLGKRNDSVIICCNNNAAYVHHGGQLTAIEVISNSRQLETRMENMDQCTQLTIVGSVC